MHACSAFAKIQMREPSEEELWSLLVVLQEDAAPGPLRLVVFRLADLDSLHPGALESLQEKLSGLLVLVSSES